jgi:transmembrane sensor
MLLLAVTFMRVPRITETTQHYATRTAQRATVTLDDGTRVMLAPQTTLRAHFSSTARMLDVDGEAYFEVARSTGAPFVVQSGGMNARVLGTAFLVRRYGDARVHIAVTEGKVQVTAERVSSPVTLSAGGIAEVTDSTVLALPPTDLKGETAWINGKLSFDDAPLSDILATLSRWYGYQFRVADPALARLHVTLVVSTHSSASALANLEQLLGVTLTVAGDTVTLTPHPARSTKVTPRIRTYDVWTPTREVGR